MHRPVEENLLTSNVEQGFRSNGEVHELDGLAAVDSHCSHLLSWLLNPVSDDPVGLDQLIEGLLIMGQPLRRDAVCGQGCATAVSCCLAWFGLRGRGVRLQLGPGDVNKIGHSCLILG